MSKKGLKAIYGLVLCIGLLTVVVTPLISSAQEPKDVTINYIEAVRVAEIPPYEVHAYVTVSDADGAPIPGIDAANFTVLEDAKKMTITEVATAVDSIAVVLVLDTSDSMRVPDQSGRVPIDEAKKAAADFIWSLADQDKVAVYSFNEEATLEIDFTIDHGAAINAVNHLTTEPKWTCLYDAAFEGVNKTAEIPEGRRAIVLLTDGVDQSDSERRPCSQVRLEDVKAKAAEINVPLYTIGLGSEVYLNARAKQDLGSLAKRTGGRSLFAPTSAELGGLFGVIANQLKNQYVIKYRSGAASAGHHSLKVKVQHKAWQDDDQKGFYTPPIPTIESVTVSAPGPVTQGEMVSIEVTVTYQSMVKKVQFYVDGEAQPPVTLPPYVWQWDTTEVLAGPHTIRVQVHDDKGPTDARELSIEIKALPTLTPTPAPRPTPTLAPTPIPCRPEILFVSPPEGLVQDEVTIEAEVATCQSRVKKVQCYINDKPEPPMTSPPYRFVWDSAQAGAGHHTLSCEVYDNEGVADTAKRSVRVREGINWYTVALLVLAVGLMAGIVVLRRRRRELEFFEEEYIRPDEISDQVTREMDEETRDVSMEPIATLGVIQSVELSPGETFELFARSTSIGRGADNDILIPDRPVSREHASLIFEEGRFRIFDVGSTFGTKVNGAPVPAEGVRLRDKDRIQVGTRTVLEFTQLEVERCPTGEETRQVEGEEETRDMGEEIESTEDTRDMDKLEQD